jgi:hypothetical protein
MNVGGYQPSNSWLRRQIDASWHRWLIFYCTGAVAVSVVMAAFIAPRQATVQMQYEIAQLSRSVDHLEGERRRLLLEREALTSPPVLAAQLDTLGLTQAGPDRVGHLTPAGDLVFPKPTPTPARPNPARRNR